jgi:hypothetical protein
MFYPYVEVNNGAVRLLQEGNYAAALPTFLVALNLFKQQVADDVAEDPKQLHFQDSLPHPPIDLGHGAFSSQATRLARRKRTALIPWDHNFFQSVPFANDVLDARTETERLHLYSRAFVLSENPEHNPAAMNRRDGTSALILYNMGATLHAQAIQTGDSSTLGKALTVYRLALSAGEHWALYSGGKTSLLHMSILNNLALVNTQLMQVSESMFCLLFLRRMVVETDGLLQADRSVFQWNVVLHMEGRLDKLPAAAA